MWLAALCASALVTPVGLALAATTPPTPLGGDSLHAAIAGQRSLTSQLRAFRAAQRRTDAARRRSQAIARVMPLLRRIAECESHGDPRAIGGGGAYRGAFQMTRSSWASVGGRGDPVDAPLSEQYRRAAMLLEASGPSQWPVCAG